MPSRLTEKTLELNVMAELAYIGRLSGYKPYFIGYSQIEELINGLDTGFNAGALIGFFQFKRGIQRNGFFTFYINNNKPHFNQHDMLLGTHKTTKACRYVLPLVGTNADIFFSRGKILLKTPFIAPDKFGTLTPSAQPHRVRVYLNGKWKRFSEYEEGSWTNIFGRIPADNSNDSQDYSQTGLRNILDLPTIASTIDTLRDIRMRSFFQQRSSFCMVFDSE